MKKSKNEQLGTTIRSVRLSDKDYYTLCSMAKKHKCKTIRQFLEKIARGEILCYDNPIKDMV